MYDDHPSPANPQPGAWVPPAQPEPSPWSASYSAGPPTQQVLAQPTSGTPAPLPYGYPPHGYQPPAYQPQWPAVPMPPAPRRVGIAAVVAIAVVAAIVGCGGGVALGLSIHSSRAGTNATAATGTAKATGTAAPSASGPVAGPTATGSVPPTPSVALGDGAALLAKILPMPAGAKAITVSGSTGGTMTLDQFLQREYPGDQTERGRMQARDFRVAAQREWLGADGIETHIQLVQFGADTGAESFALGQLNAYAVDTDVTGTFTLSGATHGTGFEKSALDKAGNRRAILLAQDGPVVVFIFLYTPGSFDRAGDISLMQRQLTALAH